jgi:hypothetical protein
MALAAGLLGARGAAAQEPLEIRVVAAGMTVAGIEVFVLVDGEPWRVGETDADGRVTAPGDLVGLRPGDPIEVHQVICSDDRSVLFVPPDESPESECERRRRGDPSCRCSSLGTVGWGGDVAVDVVAEPTSVPDYERPGRPRWWAGAGAGWISFPNLDKGCAAAPLAVACELEAEGPTFRVAGEARPRPDFPFSIMGAVGYTPELVIDHLFAASENPRDPRRNVSELEVVTFEGYAVGRFAAFSAADLFLALGYVWAYDRVEATTTFGDGGTATEERADSGGRLGGRAGLDWWSAGGGWGVRLEVGGMTGEEEDIDTSWSAVGMVLVPVGR